MKLDRRDFLRFAGGAAAGTAAGGVSARGLSSLIEVSTDQVRPPSGAERWVHSVCQGCPGACGIRVRVVGTRAVKIDGSPLHPVNRGGLCPLGQAGLQVLYHPDRLKGPVKRAGERGAGAWTPIGWDEALDTLAGRLAEIRSQQGPERLAAIVPPDAGLMGRLWDRFLKAYGSPNLIHADSDLDAAEAALAVHQGARGPVAYDLERTRFVLGLGAPLLEGYGSPVWMMRAFKSWRTGEHRTRLIQADTRLSITAAKADEWVAVRPGTMPVLGLGVAYVLLREGLYDRSFVSRHGFGFEDWEDADGRQHSGFRTMVLEQYGLDRVARATGVASETVLRLGREFARTRPSLAITGSTNRYEQSVAHALNALVGSIDTPGGMLTRRRLPDSPWPAVASDPTATDGLKAPRIDGADRIPFARSFLSGLPGAIRDGRPYEPGAVLIYGTDPLRQGPRSAVLEEALQRVPFLVSFSSFIDDTARLADLILPDHTYLERWQDVREAPVVPFSVYGLRQPVVSPVHDTRHTGDVLIDLAGRLGGTVGRSLPWTGFEQILKADVRGLFELRRGNVVAVESEEAWGRLLERTGWWAPSYRSEDELWAQMVENGGWWDEDYDYGDWARVLPTASGRFEFYSQSLAEQIERLAGGELMEAGLDRLGIQARGDTAFLPHAPGSGTDVDPAVYPLHLQPYRLLALPGGGDVAPPFALESLAPHVRNPWEIWVELNPEVARARGIADGDRVWVASARGRIQARARLFAGTPAGVVGIPLGLRRHPARRWGEAAGVDPGAIVSGSPEPPNGWAGEAPTRVRVYRA